MRFAVVDLGTNSVRFDIYERRKGKRQVSRLLREKVMVRLGQGVFLDGKLDRNAIRRTYLAFLRFKRVAQALQVQKFIAFGTSALRESSDSDQFIDLIRQRTGIEVRVISGLEEAQLIGRGILANEKLPTGRFALVDIGGGSTEILICRGKNILFAHSFPLGTARLQQIFLKRSPPRRESVTQLREYIRGVIVPRVKDENWGRAPRILGGSGTVRAVSSIVRRQTGQRQIQTADLEALVSEMQKMTTTQLLGVEGMEPDRVDMILAGAILLEEVAHSLRAKSVTPTPFALRDGILDEQLELLRNHQPSTLSIRLDDLVEKAARFGGERTHLKRVMEMAGYLFDQ